MIKCYWEDLEDQDILYGNLRVNCRVDFIPKSYLLNSKGEYIARIDTVYSIVTENYGFLWLKERNVKKFEGYEAYYGPGYVTAVRPIPNRDLNAIKKSVEFNLAHRVKIIPKKLMIML